MRFLVMHRLDERAPGAWDPSPEFIKAMGDFIQEAVASGVLITAEGVHKSDRGALIRHAGGRTTTTDGPFTEAKEVIGGFALINAKDRAEAVEFSSRYAALFDEVEVEVREVYEFEG
jgi:hypothetical protein